MIHLTIFGMTKLQESLSNNRMIQKCIDIIRTFNPVTHSIDSHIADKIGDISRPVSAQIIFATCRVNQFL